MILKSGKIENDIAFTRKKIYNKHGGYDMTQGEIIEYAELRKKLKTNAQIDAVSVDKIKFLETKAENTEFSQIIDNLKNLTSEQLDEFVQKMQKKLTNDNNLINNNTSSQSLGGENIYQTVDDKQKQLVKKAGFADALLLALLTGFSGGLFISVIANVIVS